MIDLNKFTELSKEWAHTHALETDCDPINNKEEYDTVVFDFMSGCLAAYHYLTQ